MISPRFAPAIYRSACVRFACVGFACALGALACTKGNDNNNPHPTPSGTGAVGTGTGGVGGPPPPPPSGMVTVTIQMPAANALALTGSLLPVSVTARVDQGTDVIDPTTVKAVVTAKNDTAELESTLLAAQGNDTFTGRVSIGDHPSGDYFLTVSAVSSGGLKGSSDPLPFQIDAGPQLFVRTPLPLNSYKGLLVIEVVADPGMFGPLDGPHATVANYPVQLDQVGNAADNTYRGIFNLDDPMPPNVVPRLIDQQLLSVWATDMNNKRVDVHVVFVIDEAGPQITNTTPAPGEIVGDFMQVSATITDPAGVLDSSVIAVIGDDTKPADQFTVTLKPDGVGHYSVLFDTRKLTGCPDPPSASEMCIVYPTVSFRASDDLGNESAVGYVFSVDNIAPVADLDPPRMRSYLIQDTVRCSFEFDPLSNNAIPGDMPGDRNIVPQIFDLRARIEDDGNQAPGLKGSPISLVDPDKTAVYILDDESQALIVDTDGDGWCDAINPLLVPTTEPPTNNNQVLKIRLAPVKPAGGANFMSDSALPNAFCSPGLAPTLPQPLCDLEPTIAIGYTGQAKQPAIWTLEDINPAWCFGRQFDTLANNITDNSWACIAVQTADNANNISVSAPLRVYVQQQNPIKPGTIGPGTPPACTGTYDPVMKAVIPGPCKTRKFNDYYCFNLECPSPQLPP